MSEGSDPRSERLRKQLEQGLPAGVPGWLPHQDPLPFLLKQHVLLLPLLDKVEPGLVRLLRLLKPRVVVLLLLLVILLLVILLLVILLAPPLATFSDPRRRRQGCLTSRKDRSAKKGRLLLAIHTLVVTMPSVKKIT